jgi:hypothetical protein
LEVAEKLTINSKFSISAERKTPRKGAKIRMEFKNQTTE